MFTGLVEKTGVVKRVSRGKGLVLEISFEPWPDPLEPGESVAVALASDGRKEMFAVRVIA